MPLRRLTPAHLEAVVILLQQGNQTQTEVAEMFGVSQSVISRAWRRFRDTGNPNTRHGGGRRRSTTIREDRFIFTTARRNSTFPASRLRAHTGVQVSLSTIRRRLHERGLRARRRFKCIRLTAQHRRERRNWVDRHRMWGLPEWRNCLFSDESRFCLYHSDSRILTWRRRVERYLEQNMAPTLAFGGGSITVWGGISFDSRTELLVLINESMNAQRYRDRVILPIVVPFAEEFGHDFIFMDDNARPHRAEIVNIVLQEHNIARMVWPARSPDANPIEHVWDYLKRQIHKREHAPRTLQDLANAVREEWQLMPQQFIQDLISSMPRRVEAIRQTRGGPTRY